MATSNVKSEISGGVWKVLVQPGQAISPGDTLLIIESMKMEIPVLAEDPATVVSVEVTEGQTVTEGQLLVVLEI